MKPLILYIYIYTYKNSVYGLFEKKENSKTLPSISTHLIFVCERSDFVFFLLIGIYKNSKENLQKYIY